MIACSTCSIPGLDQVDRQQMVGLDIGPSSRKRLALVGIYRAAGLRTEVSGNSVETAVRYTA